MPPNGNGMIKKIPNNVPGWGKIEVSGENGGVYKAQNGIYTKVNNTINSSGGEEWGEEYLDGDGEGDYVEGIGENEGAYKLTTKDGREIVYRNKGNALKYYKNDLPSFDVFCNLVGIKSRGKENFKGGNLISNKEIGEKLVEKIGKLGFCLSDGKFYTQGDFGHIRLVDCRIVSFNENYLRLMDNLSPDAYPVVSLRELQSIDFSQQ